MTAKNRPDMIVLDDLDNVATALLDLDPGLVRVAGPRGSLGELELTVPIFLGHKSAIRPILAGELVIKHGQPIGRATADIETGSHVHIQNVISLSRETDLEVGER